MPDALPIPELVRLAQAGDVAALQALLQRYRGFIRALVVERSPGALRGRLDGSDVVQETLLRVARNLHQFAGVEEAAWCAWLRRIAEREIIRQVRHHLGAEGRSVGREQPLPERASSSRLELWSAGESPSQGALRNERAQLLSAALSRLPADYREVLVLRHLEGQPFADVAVRLQRSVGATRVLWARALQRLRQELGGDFSSSSRGAHG